MYISPNKSLELATLKRDLQAMGRTKSGRVTKKRRRKRAYKSTPTKVRIGQHTSKIRNNMLTDRQT